MRVRRNGDTWRMPSTQSSNIDYLTRKPHSLATGISHAELCTEKYKDQ